MEIQEMIQQIVRQDIEKLILSNPKTKNFPYRKMTIRPMLIQNHRMMQMERFTDKQAFHENIEPGDLAQALQHALQQEYTQLDGFTKEATYLIKISKKGKVLFKKRPRTGENMAEAQDKAPAGQNRQKHYVLPAELAPQPLIDLGVVTPNGQVIASRYDKFKQINRLIELIGESIEPQTRALRIIDFGCGKSYLTFVLYYYLTEIRGIEVHMTGLDLKADVIENCRQIASRYAYGNLHFEIGDIAAYQPEGPVDMVISLHACDTATDYALYNAMRWQTQRIFSVPCCQHELAGQMKKQSGGTFTQHGLLKQRFAALLTDALRADLLAAQGYRVDALEFIDMEHSPKNLLLRAVKTGTADVKAKERVEQAMRQYQVEPTLYRLLYAEAKQL